MISDRVRILIAGGVFVLLCSLCARPLHIRAIANVTAIESSRALLGDINCQSSRPVWNSANWDKSPKFQGYVAMYCSNFDAAIQFLERALDLDEPFASIWLGMAYWQKGQMQQARQAWTNRESLLFLRTRCSTNAVKLTLAQPWQFEDNCRALAFLEPGSVRPGAALGALYLDRGRCAEAVETLKRAISMEPADAETLTLLGRGLSCLGNANEAIQAYEQAAQYGGIQGYMDEVQLARLYHLSGSDDLALRVCDAAIASSPTRPDAYLLKQELLLAHQDFDAARVVCEQSLKHLTPMWVPHGEWCLGVALLAAGNVEEAVHWLQKAVIHRGDEGVFHLYLARALVKQGKMPEGIAEYRKASELLRDSEDWKWYQLELAEVLTRAGNVDGANEIYDLLLVRFLDDQSFVQRVRSARMDRDTD